MTCPVCQGFRSVLVVILRANPVTDGLAIEGTEHRWCFNCCTPQWTRQQAQSGLRARMMQAKPASLLPASESRYASSAR
jgi:hypothetical protein